MTGSTPGTPNNELNPDNSERSSFSLSILKKIFPRPNKEQKRSSGAGIDNAVSEVAQRCNLEGPRSIEIRSGQNSSSGYDKENDTYYYVEGSDDLKRKTQHTLLHEAGHLVRAYNERTLGFGLELRKQIDIVSDSVEKNINGKDILGKEFGKLWWLLFEIRVSDELVGRYFGMNFSDKDTLKEARKIRSPKILQLFKMLQQEWKEKINEISFTKEGSDKALEYLKSANEMGRSWGSIFGDILAEEGADPKGIMLHDSTRVLASIESLAEQERFPVSLEAFFQDTGLLKIQGRVS